jgi:hypothetical protein
VIITHNFKNTQSTTKMVKDKEALGPAAFTVGSAEAYRLKSMFMQGKICWNCDPRELRQEFPTLDSSNTTQFRTGFNNIKKEAAKMAEFLKSK